MVVVTELMKPRILVADDDDGLRQLLRLILSREGFEVIEADSGEQALALGLALSAAILGMPGGGGGGGA